MGYLLLKTPVVPAKMRLPETYRARYATHGENFRGKLPPLLVALVDSGSTHNFIAGEAARRLGLKLTPLQDAWDLS